MAGDDISFRLDLDNIDFQKKFSDSLDSVNSMAARLEGLTTTLESVASVAGIIGVAFLAVKTAFDLTNEAEEIKQVRAQFEQLAANANLSASAIKRGMDEAAGGLVNETDLLKLANRGIVELGANAAKLPDLLALARQQLNAGFGSSIEENLRVMNDAIATGQTRGLRYIGIVVDQTVAVRDFGAAHGVAANALNETGRQQAVMEAVLRRGQETQKSIQIDVRQTRDAWLSFKAALTEFGQQIALLYEASFGPAVRTMMQATADSMHAVTNAFKQFFGSDQDKEEAKMENLKSSLAGYQRQLAELKEEQAHPSQTRYLVSDQAINQAKAKISELTKQIKDLEKKEDGLSRKPAGGAKNASSQTSGTPGINDKTKVKENEAAFARDIIAIRKEILTADQFRIQGEQSLEANHKQQILLLEKETSAKIQAIKSNENLTDGPGGQKEQEMAALHRASLEQRQALEYEYQQKRIEMRQKDLQLAMQTAQSEEQVDRIHAQQKLLIEQQLQTQIAAIRGRTDLTADQKLKEEMRLKQNAHNQEILLDQQLQAQKLQSVTVWENESKNAADGVARGFEGAAKKQALDLKNFQKTGEQAFAAFQSNAVSALQAWGAGTQSASQAAKGFIFGMLGDIAVAQGSMLMASGLVPPPMGTAPVGLVAGAALVALGGFLKSQAQGSSSSVPSASGGSAGGGGGGSSSYNSPQNNTPVVQDKITPKSVNLVIQGNYYETEQTKAKLVDMIREVADATDYTIKGVT